MELSSIFLPKLAHHETGRGYARMGFCGSRYNRKILRSSESKSLKNKAAIVGLAELKPWKEAPPDITPLKLMSRLTVEAIADSGLEKKDIDGFLVGMPFADPGMLYPASACEVLGINARMLNQVDIGGADVVAGGGWPAAAPRVSAVGHTGPKR